ncbi:hypothetical protein [Flavobacterium phage FL-1]|nr:hypothetical protein [Flavobacterium phage FL-1]
MSKYLSDDRRVGLISVSGGETSLFMLWWLLKNKKHIYRFKIVFANTGRENEATLVFLKRCSEYFGVEIIWVESNVWGSVGEKTKHKIVTFETATRNQDWKKTRNTPYEQMVIKYGLPSISNRFSTRELKDRPIQSYMRSLGLSDEDYDIFIGIRFDELDRQSEATDRSFVYPLIKWMKWTKKHVNFWWSKMPFRLVLKGWEGNCMTCYKKTLEKLTQIFIDDAWKFEFDDYLEWRYGYYIPERRIKKLVQKLKPLPEMPFKLFRFKNGVADIREKSMQVIKSIKDDTQDNSYQTKLFEESESCEVFFKVYILKILYQ